MASQGSDRGSPGEALAFSADLALLSGGPVLVVPHSGACSPIGRNVMICRNDSREAMRGVGDGIGLLRDAYAVTVPAVSEHDDGTLSPDPLLRFLERQEIQARAELRSASGRQVSDVIVECALAGGIACCS